MVWGVYLRSLYGVGVLVGIDFIVYLGIVIKNKSNFRFFGLVVKYIGFLMRFSFMFYFVSCVILSRLRNFFEVYLWILLWGVDYVVKNLVLCFIIELMFNKILLFFYLDY